MFVGHREMSNLLLTKLPSMRHAHYGEVVMLVKLSFQPTQRTQCNDLSYVMRVRYFTQAMQRTVYLG